MSALSWSLFLVVFGSFASGGVASQSDDLRSPNAVASKPAEVSWQNRPSSEVVLRVGQQLIVSFPWQPGVFGYWHLIESHPANEIVTFLQHDSEAKSTVDEPKLGGVEQLRFWFEARKRGNAELEFRFVRSLRATVTDRAFIVKATVVGRE